MATAVQIEVILDEKGVVQGVQNINNGMDQMGKRGLQVFSSMTKGQREAREAAMLLGRAVGIEVPSALEKVMSKIPPLAGALRGLFNVAMVATFAFALVGIVNHFDEVTAGIRKAGFELSVFGERVRSWFGGGNADLIAGAEELKISKLLVPLEEQRVANMEKVATIGKQGYAQVNAELKNTLDNLHRLAGIQGGEAIAQFGAGTEKSKDALGRIQQATAAAEQAARQAAGAQYAAVTRERMDAERKAMNEAVLINLKGSEAILERKRQEIADIEALARRGVISHKQAENEKQTASFKAAQEIQKLYEDFSDQIDKLEMDSAASTATGMEKIVVETKNRILELNREFIRTFGALDPNDPVRLAALKKLDTAVGAVNAQGNSRTNEMVRDAGEATRQAEERAAVASVRPWQRANVEIVTDYNQRLRDIDLALSQHLITEEDGQRRRAAAWTEANAKIQEEHRRMVNDLANELDSFWDDIFSGNFGQRILKEARHFFDQIIASWLLSTRQGNAAFAGTQNGGGFLGGILNLLGFGGQGGGFSAPVVGGAFGGSGNLLSGFPSDILMLGVPGASSAIYGPPTGPSGLIGTLPLGASTLSAGAGTAGSVASQTSMLGMLGMPSALAKIFPNSLSIGGHTISGPTLGMMGVSLGIGGILQGYQSGSMLQGGIMSGLGGIATGLAIGGPIGAAVGGLMFLGGILGGLFGGTKRKHQAKGYAEYNLIPTIEHTVEDYKAHALEYQQALSQIEQLRTQGQANLAQLGSQGNFVYRSEVEPAVLRARQEIEQVQAERNRRSALDFGAPQFHSGGFVMGWRLGNGEVAAILKEGEFVVNQQATAKNRSALEAMNDGADAGSVVHLHLHVNDVESWKFYLRNGGAREIQTALNFESLNYTGNGF